MVTGSVRELRRVLGTRLAGIRPWQADIICMDGLDLSEALTRELPLNKVLERKVRHAAETGMAFGRVRDLFL